MSPLAHGLRRASQARERACGRRAGAPPGSGVAEDEVLAPILHAGWPRRLAQSRRLLGDGVQGRRRRPPARALRAAQASQQGALPPDLRAEAVEAPLQRRAALAVRAALPGVQLQHGLPERLEDLAVHVEGREPLELRDRRDAQAATRQLAHGAEPAQQARQSPDAPPGAPQLQGRLDGGAVPEPELAAGARDGGGPGAVVELRPRGQAAAEQRAPHDGRPAHGLLQLRVKVARLLPRLGVL
mmetsp:Transcript_83409/g.269834  ORF Transcript_83409/g.269834 Transcript_83409/m.269834 type:complete len:242 (-) Transcript_83409:1011-1736(-)